MLRIQHNGKNYEWSRMSTGRGAWCRNNVIVHLELDNELTSQARKAGMNDGLDFARFPPKPVEEEKPKRRKGSGRRSISVKARHAVKLRLKR